MSLDLEVTAKQASHWRATRALTIFVLLLWFVFGFVVPWNAHYLNQFSFLGFELGYYMVVQGSLIAFVVLIVIQNLIQDGIDKKYGFDEE